jgi:hypothetical protein
MHELTPTQPKRVVTAQSAAGRAYPTRLPFSRRALLGMFGGAFFVPLGLVLLLRLSERRRAPALHSSPPAPAAPSAQAQTASPAARATTAAAVDTPAPPSITPSVPESPPEPAPARSRSRRRRTDRSSERLDPREVPALVAPETLPEVESMDGAKDTPTDHPVQPDSSPAAGAPERDESNPYIYKSTEGWKP